MSLRADIGTRNASEVRIAIPHRNLEFRAEGRGRIMPGPFKVSGPFDVDATSSTSETAYPLACIVIQGWRPNTTFPADMPRSRRNHGTPPDAETTKLAAALFEC
jgi:hypothetical protein